MYWIVEEFVCECFGIGEWFCVLVFGYYDWFGVCGWNVVGVVDVGLSWCFRV